MRRRLLKTPTAQDSGYAPAEPPLLSRTRRSIPPCVKCVKKLGPIQQGTVSCFGEVVDIYENGVIVSHEGSWRADALGNTPGIFTPANPQEVVHGAFAESASWDSVIDPLLKAGHPVIAAANPLRDLASDAASIADLVRTIDEPVVLVAHSYGGAAISNVPADAGEITGLVYVNGFAPDPDESCFSLAGLFPGSTLGTIRCGRFRAATARPTCTSSRTATTTCSAQTCRC
jgi:hypothetical protein